MSLMPATRDNKKKPLGKKWGNRTEPKFLEGIGAQVEAGKHTGGGELKWLLVSEITPDPEQPRTRLTELGINASTVKAHNENTIDLASGDAPKTEAFLALRALADNINEHELMQPISVYSREDGNGYWIESGERRYLAHLLLGRTEIQTIVSAPAQDNSARFERQLAENISREDLTLKERVTALFRLNEMRRTEKKEPFNRTTLAAYVGMSIRNAARYLTVINGPDDVIEAINTGSITRLNEAVRLGAIENVKQRAFAIENGINVVANNTTQATKPVGEGDDQDAKSQHAKPQHTQITSDTINLGSTTNPETVKHVIKSVLGETQYDNCYRGTDWEKSEVASKVWKDFWNNMETIVSEK